MNTRSAPEQALLELEWIVRALAQAYEVQRTLFPAFVCVADELALEFEERSQKLEGCPELILSATQSAKLTALDDALAAMSGSAHADLWTDEALSQSAEWECVRSLAAEFASSMQWPAGAPSPTADIYVGPDA